MGQTKDPAAVCLSMVVVGVIYRNNVVVVDDDVMARPVVSGLLLCCWRSLCSVCVVLGVVVWLPPGLCQLPAEK